MKKIASWFLIILSALCSLFFTAIISYAHLIPYDQELPLLEIQLVSGFLILLGFAGIWAGIKILAKISAKKLESNSQINKVITLDYKIFKTDKDRFISRLKGIGIIVFGSFALMTMMFALGMIVLGNYHRVGDNNEFLPFYMLIPTCFFGFIFMYGIQMFTMGRKIPRINHTEDLSIQFKSRIGYQEYRQFYIKEMLNNPFYRCMGFIFVGILFTLLLNDATDDTKYMLTAGCVIVFFSLLPMFRIKKNYQSSPVLNGEVEYIITNNSIRLISDKFDAKLNWEMFVRIKETKDFILLYQNVSIATFIPKKILKETDMTQLRYFLRHLVSTRQG